MKKLKKDGVPSKIVEGIENGRKLTTKEWAVELNTTRQHVNSVLTSLRKRGLFLHPEPMPFSKEGVVIDVMQNHYDARVALKNYEGKKYHPFSMMMYAMGKTAVEKYPELADELSRILENSLFEIIQLKKSTLAGEMKVERALESEITANANN